MQLYQLDCTFPDTLTEKAQEILSQIYPEGWEEMSSQDKTTFRLLSQEKDVLENVLAALKDAFSSFEHTLSLQDFGDWLSSWKENFKPCLCGTRFVVLPPWLGHEKDHYPQRIPIIIEPKNAFGTGQHETTALCLALLSELLDGEKLSSHARFLDLGTGTGILAFGASLAGLTGMGIDIDPCAIENAHENAALNPKADCRFEEGSIETLQSSKFDLIFANILASPLIEMADMIVQTLAEKGFLILSGILETQRKDVSKAYEEKGLTLVQKSVQGEWAALLFQKN